MMRKSLVGMICDTGRFKAGSEGVLDKESGESADEEDRCRNR